MMACGHQAAAQLNVLHPQPGLASAAACARCVLICGGSLLLHMQVHVFELPLPANLSQRQLAHSNIGLAITACSQQSASQSEFRGADFQHSYLPAPWKLRWCGH